MSSQNSNSNGASVRSDGVTDLSADLVQWRQDIETFAMATRQMLGSIHDELSTGLASGDFKTTVATAAATNQPPNAARPIPTRQPEQQPLPTSRPAPAAPQSLDDCDALLAQLKQQLADQLADS